MSRTIITPSAEYTSRPFRDETDFWRVRRLLIDTLADTPVGWTWDIRRWDGWRFHRECSDITPEWSQQLHLWETVDGQLVGAAHPEDPGEVYLEIHPDFRADIEDDMFAWAEQNLAGDSLLTWVFDYDVTRQNLLRSRGYAPTDALMVVRHMRMSHREILVPRIAAPYVLRSTEDTMADCARVAAVLNAGFNRTSHTAAEFHTFATESPSYRADLNLVAEAPDGTFAALVGLTIDTESGRAIIEPVCTHPDHRRHGLAHTLIQEGMRRVQALGAVDITVETGGLEAANKLYDDFGFSGVYRGVAWRKTFE